MEVTITFNILHVIGYIGLIIYFVFIVLCSWELIKYNKLYNKGYKTITLVIIGLLLWPLLMVNKQIITIPIIKKLSNAMDI